MIGLNHRNNHAIKLHSEPNAMRGACMTVSLGVYELAKSKSWSANDLYQAMLASRLSCTLIEASSPKKIMKPKKISNDKKLIINDLLKKRGM